MASSSRRIPLLLILCGLAPADGAAAAAAGLGRDGGAPPPGEPVVELDEVPVIGRTLRQLRREAIKAEDRFYERFNTINTRDDFDIHCRMEKATGTIVPKRQCRIQFLMDTEAMDAREFVMGLTTAAAARGVHTPLAPVQTQWVLRREEYRQTVKALLEKDPELMRLAREWVRLKEQYERVRDERHQDGFVQF